MSHIEKFGDGSRPRPRARIRTRLRSVALCAVTALVALAVGPLGPSAAQAGTIGHAAAHTSGHAGAKTSDTAGAQTIVSVEIQQTPITLGAQAVVTVAVAPLAGTGTPTGSVQVDVDGSPSGAPVTLINGNAEWYSSSLGAGSRAITASYSGDSTFAAAAGAAQNLVVLPAGTSAYVPLSPARVLDTRAGAGQTGYTGGRPGPGATVRLQIEGRGGVPGKAVTAVALNVTMTNSEGGGYVTVWPDGDSRPLASNVNATGPGRTVANLADVPVGADGYVDLYTSAGTDLVADVQGYFAAATSTSAGRLVPVLPARILDTRAGPKQTGYKGTRPAPGAVVPLQVTGTGGLPATGVKAVAMNVTATNSKGGGYVTVWPAGIARPLASNINVAGPAQTKANAVWVPVGANGVVDLYTSGGTDLVADVDGYYTDATADESSAGLFVPVVPTRLLDTRSGSRQTGYHGAKPLPGQTVQLAVAGNGPVAAVPIAAAVVGNTTATDATGPGYVTVWPGGASRPLASNVNLQSVGDTAATMTTSPLSAGGSLNLYTSAGADLIFDVSGYFTGDLDALPATVSDSSYTTAAGTSAIQPTQVASIAADGPNTVVVLNAGVAAPAVGSGLGVLAGAAYPDGASGTVSSVTPQSDGTTSVVLAPASLDSLFSSLKADYSGAADLQLVNAANGDVVTSAARAAAGSSGGGFNFASAFQCSGSASAVEVASLSFENSRAVFHNLSGSSVLHPHIYFTLSTEPVVSFNANFTGTVTCSLTSAFQNAYRLRFLVPNPADIPITVTMKPTLSLTVTGKGNGIFVEHFYHTIGFDTDADGNVKPINSGSQTTDQANIDATLTASLSMGVVTTVQVLKVAGITVTMGPEFDMKADADSQSQTACISLTAQFNASVQAQLNLWVVKWKSKTYSVTLGPWTLYTNCPVTITTTTLPDGETDTSYDAILQAKGGSPPYQWSIVDGALPDGLVLDPNGEISGTPTTGGESEFTVEATDTAHAHDDADLVVDVAQTTACNFTLDISSCESTQPTVSVSTASSGDTSNCSFQADLNWGDGSADDIDTFNGGPDGTPFLLGVHTYAAAGNYTITVVGSVLSGNCSYGGGTLSFTLVEPGGTSSASKQMATNAAPRPMAPPTGRQATSGASPANGAH